MMWNDCFGGNFVNLPHSKPVRQNEDVHPISRRNLMAQGHEWIVLLTLLCFALLLLSGCSASSEPFARAPLPVEPAFPIPIVELHGSSQQLGEEQAAKLSVSIQQLHDNYLVKFVGSGYKRMVALSAASVFEKLMLPEHRDEMRALAAASNIDERETMLGQCFLDLAQLSACSTVALPASASPDHVARLGRNLDFSSLNIADKYTIVEIVRPSDGRYTYAAIAWPGMIGVLSGMNQHGLCLSNMEVPRTTRLPTAMPYTLLYRTVLEHCKTVQEAVDLLKCTPRQSANNLMLMDAFGSRAVAELTPEGVNVRWGADDSALISTNHQRDQDTQTPGRCDRYDYLRQTSDATFGQIDRQQVEKMLAYVGNRTTLQSMVFEPASRVIYLAAGTRAADKPFSRLDLKKYFDAQ